MTPDLLRALKARKEAIERDDRGWFLRELACARWCADTVFPAAVVRWVDEIGRRPEWTSSQER